MSTIPNYQKLMKPILLIYSDGQEHGLREVADRIADELNLSIDERAQRVPSGMPVYVNRVSWAHTYLRKAGLLESVERGFNRITVVGKNVLASEPDNIDNEFLNKFESFREFKAQSTKRDIDNQAPDLSDAAELTPQERIQTAIKEHDSVLEDNVLETLRDADPYYFEKIVAELLEAMGYGVATVTQRTNDGGIDAIVNEDALGLSKIYVQAKRYGIDSRVNRKELRDFVGALELKGVSKGVFITTSDFHRQAKDDLRSTQKSIVLVNGKRLARLLIDRGIGVAVEKTYEVKRLDIDYFDYGES